MRLAVISDIHANQAALEAVLNDIQEPDRILCCGDLVGYYDRPNEVCALLREWNVECIRGNHDAYVLGDLLPNEARRHLYRTDWTRDALKEETRQWLSLLPAEHRLECDGRRLRLRHASPWDEETYLHGYATQVLARLDLDANETLAVGHTHRPLHVRVGKGWLLNPGSVGQPRDLDPRASYVVLDLSSGKAQHHRVSYDVAGLQHRLQELGWDPGVVAMLSRTE